MAAFSPSLPVRRRSSGGIAPALLVLIWWWVCREVAARAATGLMGSFAGGAFVPLLGAVFLLFLTVLGVVAVDTLRRREGSTLRELLALPRRPTLGREWGLGAAVGWGAVVLAVLPLVLLRSLRVQVWLAPLGWMTAAISLGTLAAVTLAAEVVFRGYGFRQMERSIGPNRAMLVLAAIYAFSVSFSLGSGRALVVSFLLAVLLTTGWRRTHALWLPWGLHFAWSASLGILFGLPLFNGTQLASVVQAQVTGAGRFQGNSLGPIGSGWTMAVLLIATLLLVWLTRDFAWNYTHRPIVPAGYPMEVAPPSAHRAMEQAAPPPPLVQIQPSTPQEATRSGPLGSPGDRR